MTKNGNIAYMIHDSGLRSMRGGGRGYEQRRTYRLSIPYRGRDEVELRSRLMEDGGMSTDAGEGVVVGAGFDATLERMGYDVARPDPFREATFIRNNGRQTTGMWRQTWDLYGVDPDLEGCGRVLVCRRTWRTGGTLTRLFRFFPDGGKGAAPLPGSVIGDATRCGALQSIGCRVDGEEARLTVGRVRLTAGARSCTWLSLLLPVMGQWGEGLGSIVGATMPRDGLSTPFDPSRVDTDVTAWTGERVYFSMIDADGTLTFEMVPRRPCRGMEWR